MTQKFSEGPRGFAVLLHEIDQGALHEELSQKTQAVVSNLTTYVDAYCTSAKGKLTLEIEFKAEPNGTVSVHGEVKTKLPPPRRSSSVFWATKGGNLSTKNPKQQELPLREVPRDNQPARDVDNARGDARSV